MDAGVPVCGQGVIGRVGVEPWPADRDTAADGFAFLEDGSVAGENDRCFIPRLIMC